MYGNEVEVSETKFEDKYKNMPYRYANHIVNGEDIHPMLTLDANMDVMALLDTAIRSSKSGKEEKISE